MTKALNLYSRELLASYEARDDGDIHLEDEILTRLDHLWLAMSPDEREQSKAVARDTRIRYESQRQLTGRWQVDAFGLLAGADRGCAGSFDFAIGKKPPSVRGMPLSSFEFGWASLHAAAA